ARIRLAFDLVGPDRPVRDPEIGRGLARHLYLARGIARRDRGHRLHPVGPERAHGERQHHRRVHAAGEGHEGPIAVPTDPILEIADHRSNLDAFDDRAHRSSARGRYASAEACACTERTGRPSLRAASTMSACSGFAFRVRPSRTPSFTRIRGPPSARSISTIRRSSSGRETSCTRTPSVVVASKNAHRTLYSALRSYHAY